MLDKLIDLSLKYRLLVIVLFISICALGFRAYKNIPVDAFPDITPKQVVIYTESPGNSAEDIEKMKKDAELHADEDAKKKELVDVKNSADLTIFTAEKALTEHAAHITEDIKTAVEEKIKELKSAKEGSDKGAIETAMHALSTEMQKIGEAVSKAQTQNPSADGASSPEGGVKDAEAEEKKEE
jgi:hypothetical protein